MNALCRHLIINIYNKIKNKYKTDLNLNCEPVSEIRNSQYYM